MIVAQSHTKKKPIFVSCFTFSRMQLFNTCNLNNGDKARNYTEKTDVITCIFQDEKKILCVFSQQMFRSKTNWPRF